MKATRFRLHGGLGNQLFIYFGAAAYAQKIGSKTIIFETSGLKDASSPRDFYLDSFKFPFPYSHDSSILPKPIKRITNFIKRNLPKPLSNLGSFQIAEVGFSEEYFELDVREISGYFQSWKYFEMVAKQTGISKVDLQVKVVSDWAKSLQKKVLEINPIICHIRRGDYMQLREHFGVLGYDYYEGGIQLLRSSGANGPVWVFTDSPELISQEFLSQNKAELIISPELSSDLDSFAVMQSGKYHVISNSTFSWWAAFSSDPVCVVAPSKWFRGLTDPINLIPSRWKRYESMWT